MREVFILCHIWACWSAVGEFKLLELYLKVVREGSVKGATVKAIVTIPVEYSIEEPEDVPVPVVMNPPTPLSLKVATVPTFITSVPATMEVLNPKIVS